jgi:hypothetical protein
MKLSVTERYCMEVSFFFVPQQDMFFYSEEMLALPSTSNLEDHPLSAVRDCLFNIFLATLHIGGRYFIRDLRTRLAVVTGNL